MGFKRVSTLLAAAMAIFTPVAAQAACDPAAGLTFICGMTNAEDLVEVPGTPWIVAGGLAEGEHTDGHIYLVNAPDRSVQVLLPGHVDYQQDTETFGACPRAPDETKFSALASASVLARRRNTRSMWCITASGSRSRSSS